MPDVTIVPGDPGLMSKIVPAPMPASGCTGDAAWPGSDELPACPMTPGVADGFGEPGLDWPARVFRDLPGSREWPERPGSSIGSIPSYTA